MVTVKASILDRAFAGSRIYVFVGPARLRTPEAVRASLRSLARQGPQNRVGLTPSSHSRWAFDPESMDAWSVERESVGARALDVVEELMQLGVRPSPAPVVVRMKGNHALFSFDHGLGDAHFMNELSALCTGDDDAVQRWRPATVTAHPASSALASAVAEHPVGVFGGLGALIRDRITVGKGREQSEDDGTRRGLIATPAVAFATSQAGYADGLREVVAQGPQASLMSTVIVATIRAFENRGVLPRPEAVIMVDLRRYLRPGSHTLANFVSSVSVPTAAGTLPHDVDRRLRGELDSFRPLLKHCRQEVTHVLPRNDGEVLQTGGGGASLVFSEGTPARVGAKYAWDLAAGPPTLAATLTLQRDDQISVFISRLPGGIVQMCASFFQECHVPESVRGALNDVLVDPNWAAAVAAIGQR